VDPRDKPEDDSRRITLASEGAAARGAEADKGRHEAAMSYRVDKFFLCYHHAIAISVDRTRLLSNGHRHKMDRASVDRIPEEEAMKVWSKPAVREQEVGLEVTSYLPAEIDII
jgi:coenzyme PQQ precursor peptide PqqA